MNPRTDNPMLSYTGLLTACRAIMAADDAGAERPAAEVAYVTAFRAALDAAMASAEQHAPTPAKVAA